MHSNETNTLASPILMEASKVTRLIPITNALLSQSLLKSHSLSNLKPSKVRIRISNNKNTPKISSSSNNPSLSTEFHESGPHRVSTKREISDELRKETEEILEWPSVCSQVSAFAATAAGRARCECTGLRIGGSREESEKLLRETKAAVLLRSPLDFSGVDDVSEIVRKAVDGGLLRIPELCAVGRSVRAARGVFEQLERIASDGESSDER